MDIYIASQGESLDMICFKAYKSLDDEVLGEFLRHNTSLLHLKKLQGGEVINLPNIKINKTKEVKYLWQ